MPSVAQLVFSSRTFNQAAEQEAAETAQAEAEAEAEAEAFEPVPEREDSKSTTPLSLNVDDSSEPLQSHSAENGTDNGNENTSASRRNQLSKLNGHRMLATLSEIEPINSDCAAPPASSSSSLPSSRVRGVRRTYSFAAGGATAGVGGGSPKLWLSFKAKMYLHALTFFLFYLAYLILMLLPVNHFESGAIVLEDEYAWFDAGYVAVVVHCAGGGFADVWPITRIARFVSSLHFIIVFLLLVVP